MPTTDQVRAAVDAYVTAFSARERDAWLAVFAEEASVIDPVPAEPSTGRNAIGAFWDGMTSMADRIVLVQRGLHVCGDQAAMEYTLTLGPADGGGMSFKGVEIFTVDDGGLITSAVAYWDPSEIHPAEPSSERPADGPATDEPATDDGARRRRLRR